MINKKLLRVLAFATAATLVACSGSGGDSSTRANASYAMGYYAGSNLFANPNFTASKLSEDKVLAGFKDAISANKPAISQEDIQANMSQFSNAAAAKANQERLSGFLAARDIIYNSSLTPKSDTKQASVILYEFFDYQCFYCSKIVAEIDKVIQDNSDLEVVFVEFPIFGRRYRASQYAAEAGTAIYKLYGAKTYTKYHNGIFATGENEGNLKESTVDKIAKQAGAKIDDVKRTIKDQDIAGHLKSILSMGSEDIKIQGTPFLVVTPVKNTNQDNTTVIGGYTDSEQIQQAINKARGGAG